MHGEASYKYGRKRFGGRFPLDVDACLKETSWSTTKSLQSFQNTMHRMVVSPCDAALEYIFNIEQQRCVEKCWNLSKWVEIIIDHPADRSVSHPSESSPESFLVLVPYHRLVKFKFILIIFISPGKGNDARCNLLKLKITIIDPTNEQERSSGQKVIPDDFPQKDQGTLSGAIQLSSGDPDELMYVKKINKRLILKRWKRNMLDMQSIHPSGPEVFTYGHGRSVAEAYQSLRLQHRYLYRAKATRNIDKLGKKQYSNPSL